MGLRQRNGFDGIPQPQDGGREDLNLTKYDERFILPTDARAFSGALEPTSPTASPAPPAPTAPPEPAFRDRSFVFGGDSGRASAFSPKPEEHGYVLGGQPQNAAADTGAYSTGNVGEPVKTGERPMVFVMRDDRNMYAYEYSDRLEFYRRTERGMVYCATRYKNLSR